MQGVLFWGVWGLGLGLLCLILWRYGDHRADRREQARLLALQPVTPARFHLGMVADLCEPARRFFGFAICDGTPLYTVARLRMDGQFGLGDRAAPGYMPMRAWQVLAAPEGFLWKMAAGRWLMRMAGSDSGAWTRFWLLGLVPVARLGGDADHRRSAFGRYVAEAVFWTPAAVLPGPHVEWEEVSANVARVTMRHQGMEQSVDLTLGADGRPEKVAFLRWSNANPEKTFRLQPFGGTLSDFRLFDGFRLPTHMEAGNHFGTKRYFPFFIARVTALEFPQVIR